MRENKAVIDIGSSQLVTLVGRRGVNKTINIIGRGDFSYAGFQNGEFLEPESLKFAIANSISNAEMTSETKVTDIFIGVPGEFCRVVTKPITLNFPKAKRITNMDVESIFRSGNNFDDDPYYELINHSVIYYDIDNRTRVIDPVSMKAQKVTGQISYILASRYFTSMMRSIFGELKIEISGYICNMLAESLHLFEPSVRDKYAILVDCGYISTSVALSRGNGLLALNSFSLGGGYITSDLSQCLKISFSEAERLKHKVVLGWNPTSADTYEIGGEDNLHTYVAKATNEIVSDRIEMICDYVQKCIDNFIYDLPEFLPVYVTGGGFNFIRGVKNIISGKLKRRVELVTSKGLYARRPNDTSEESLLSITVYNEDLVEKFIVK